MDLKKTMRDVLEVIIPALLLFLVIRTFFVDSRYVPSGSMRPTIMEWDRFLIEKVSYRFNPPKRGDIVVFHTPETAVKMHQAESIRQGGKSAPLYPFVKRIIGLPGEVVMVREGAVYINGEKLEEPYISPERRPVYQFGPVKIPEGEYFMLGDNRNQSWDSHVWGFVPRKNFIGRAFWRFWPLNRIGTLK
ncbi:MAG TPA: signal peptidase I [Bacillota bacterium]